MSNLLYCLDPYKTHLMENGFDGDGDGDDDEI